MILVAYLGCKSGHALWKPLFAVRQILSCDSSCFIFRVSVYRDDGFILLFDVSSSINVNWRHFERDYHRVFDRDGDGKVTTEDFKLSRCL